MKIRGKVIAVFGSKGGVGKTTVALNTAVLLARTKGRKVALLELTEDGGSLGAYLGLEAVPCFPALLELVEELEPKALANELLLHKTGIKLLFSPTKPLLRAPLAGKVERLVHLLTYTQDYIVVDCGQHLGPATMALLDLAQLIMLVTTGELVALQAALAKLSALSVEGFPLNKVQLLVNRYNSLSPPQEQIKKLMPVDVLGYLPEEARPLASAQSSGFPLASNSDCNFIKKLERVGGRLPELLARLQNPPSRLWPGQEGKQISANKEQWLAMKRFVQERLLDDLTKGQLAGEQIEVYTPQMTQKVKRILGEEGQFAEEMASHLFGLGLLDQLLADETISEIMVNGPGPVYVERDGLIEKTDCFFESSEEITRLIQRIAGKLGRRIDESSPMVDARLEDGSRVNAVLPPVALSGPILTIRKFAPQSYSIQELVEFGSLDEAMANFLQLAVEAKCNIVVSGGASSGKTTTLGALSAFIDPGERIITIEDAAELKLLQSHVLSLETRPANIEGRGEITIRQLVRNALRMRPDRIIVGEVRGDEVMDMVQAMNTGHSGSLSTVHANSPSELLTRLEGMMLMASPALPLISVREQIAAAIDLIIYQERMKDGSRKIMQISEVLGIEGQEIKLQDLFQYQGGKFVATGARPRFAVELAQGAKLKELVETG